MGKERQEFGTGARLLVILYALGIVILGAYPIRHDLRQMKDIAATVIPRWLARHSPVSIESRPQNERRLVLDPESPNRSSGPGIAPDGLSRSEAPSKHVDRLSDSDRKELENLVNSY